MGEMTCDFANQVCTKAAARRCSDMSPYAIVLLMKRIKCWRDEKTNIQKCSVFKVCICLLYHHSVFVCWNLFMR